MTGEPGDAGSRSAIEHRWALREFLDHRPRMFRIALRIVGDVPRAEDCVQEAWVRWQLTDHARVVTPSAFLATTVTHLALNLVQTAAQRREIASEWFADDLVDGAQDPAGRVERNDAVAQVLKTLMARLSRTQLVAILLRKGFAYPYADIARLLKTSVPNARQLIRRGQARVAAGRDLPVDAADHRLLLAAFLIAAREGECRALERLLTRDLVACPPPITGRTERELSQVDGLPGLSCRAASCSPRTPRGGQEAPNERSTEQMNTAAPISPDESAHVDDPSTDADFEIAVHRREERHEYVAASSTVEIATVHYQEADGRVVLLTTTVVPAFRRRGIADELIAYVLDDLRERNAHVTVLCPVMQAFIATHVEYQDLLDPQRSDF
ncbi:GNAT family N-acetyltransferase [Microbacterium yannicii]|uniref:GNAT family N-acetyltransferase n=1 Tax=Microbacterium yannicii TaxID=671622 RepID=UPI000316DEA9|nr:GNAT family N-acetyltransferase [Microbacterium yannicii]